MPSGSLLRFVLIVAIVGGYFPPFRLRKIHLVRPDLIQYPIMDERVC
jgi:hypothetical protein